MINSIDAARREELRQALRSGSLKAADAAFNELLAPEYVETQDFVLALDMIERLGTPAEARMGETFLLLAQDLLSIALPAIVGRIEGAPLSNSGDLAAAVICELLEWTDDGLTRIDRDRVLRSLVAAVEHVSRTRCERPWCAVRALALWSAKEPIPDAGTALVGLLARVVALEDANVQLVRDALEALRRSGQDQLLGPVRAIAAQLPPAHPLRELLA